MNEQNQEALSTIADGNVNWELFDGNDWLCLFVNCDRHRIE
jgi:hypothetical protein